MPLFNGNSLQGMTYQQYYNFFYKSAVAQGLRAFGKWQQFLSPPARGLGERCKLPKLHRVFLYSRGSRLPVPALH